MTNIKGERITKTVEELDKNDIQDKKALTLRDKVIYTMIHNYFHLLFVRSYFKFLNKYCLF